eukprot:jgi/Botrbrau1/10966/Bobra.0383s0020.1
MPGEKKLTQEPLQFGRGCPFLGLRKGCLRILFFRHLSPRECLTLGPTAFSESIFLLLWRRHKYLQGLHPMPLHLLVVKLRF